MTHAAGPTLAQLGLHLKFSLGCNRSNAYFRFSHSNATSTCLNKCQSWWRHQMKSFPHTGPLWGEPTRRKLDSHTKTSDTKHWCFLWCSCEQTFEQTVEMPVIWDAMALIVTWHQCNVNWKLRQINEKQKLDRSPKVHYFSAFSVRKLNDGCRLLGVTKWNELFSLCKYIMISLMLRIVNPWTVPYLL